MNVRATLSRVRSTRPSPVVLILSAFTALGVLVALIRFVFGIGAISNLNNSYPWGLWISLDLLCGVALGAGAFTMAAVVYIFNLKRFRPLLRPSILTGFLGYVMVILALLVDLGRPERIWHLIVYQNGHSVLFEIGICVMLYTTVLALEFLPVLMERPNWEKPLRILHSISLPLVILGVVLSTLHQSSLGSLFLIMPQKLNPLWYSPLLPLFFFVSAVAVGLAMVIVESSISARAFRRGLEVHLLSQLAQAIPYVLGLYVALKFGALVVEGKLGLLFQVGLPALLFWLEVIGGAVAPIALFSRRAMRENRRGLLIGALFVIGGLMLNRFNVSLFAVQHQGSQSYTPNLMEFAVSFGIISAGILAFGFVAKFFPLFESGEHVSQRAIAQPAPSSTLPTTAQREAA
ncbi:MAG TPA: Ni/Fe-hydrogenase cytochrome b subunit [Anaerolineae bacterium]|nr:Ni/Fe-hydrogenase cytochrome b subunit [Anaerolineae bacterium]